MRFMAYQHHNRTDSHTELVIRIQLLCIYTTKIYKNLYQKEKYNVKPVNNDPYFLQQDYLTKLMNT